MIALVTAIVVFAVGVEQGIILAIVLSILEIIRRAYTPKDFLVGVDREGETIYVNAVVAAFRTAPVSPSSEERA